MITCIQLEHSDIIQQLRDDYLRTLVAPMDGMWEIEQDYNAQVAVEQGSLLIVGWALSNHPNDSQEAEPTLAKHSNKPNTFPFSWQLKGKVLGLLWCYR